MKLLQLLQKLFRPFLKNSDWHLDHLPRKQRQLIHQSDVRQAKLYDEQEAIIDKLQTLTPSNK